MTSSSTSAKTSEVIPLSVNLVLSKKTSFFTLPFEEFFSSTIIIPEKKLDFLLNETKKLQKN